jgi:molybdopterin-guanine dinucleotide biosynthesis protein A
MGRDKARLRFRSGELADAVLREVASVTGSATLVGHTELPGIPDRYPGEGPLGGILTALHHTSTDWNLIVACDMPEVTAAFLAGLVGRALGSPAAVVMPRGPDGRAQPLCAVYRQSARSPLGQQFSRGVREVVAALASLEVEPFEVADLLYFQNVNTPEDWARYAAK